MLFMKEGFFDIVVLECEFSWGDVGLVLVMYVFNVIGIVNDVCLIVDLCYCNGVVLVVDVV